MAAAISKGMFCLDSHALAALLKELHKVGLSNRSAASCWTLQLQPVATQLCRAMTLLMSAQHSEHILIKQALMRQTLPSMRCPSRAGRGHLTAPYNRMQLS